VTTAADPLALPRSRNYLKLLAIAAVLGAPVSAAAYGFLALVSYLQEEIFAHLPAKRYTAPLVTRAASAISSAGVCA